MAFAARPGGVLIKPKRMVDPDDILTREESALVKKAEREMNWTIDWRMIVHHEAAKQLEAIPQDRPQCGRSPLQNPADTILDKYSCLRQPRRGCGP